MLTDVLNIVEAQEIDTKKSIWLQGSYGTGKSHATSVIKHLLSDPVNEITDFTENFDNAALKSRIKSLRQQGIKAFPVVIKGTSGITSSRTLPLVIEKSVKRALVKNDIKISTQTDFEKYLYQVKHNPTNIDWNKLINDHQELKIYARNTDALIKRLENQDISVLRNLETIAEKTGVFFTHTRITDWLVEVVNELKRNNYASNLIIYWDEFTSVLELEAVSSLLTELQHIADLSIDQGIYLFMVSHRRPKQANISTEDIEKVLGRFKVVEYAMEPLTTYHIVSASIKKKDWSQWELLKDTHMPQLESLISTIVGVDHDPQKNTLLKNLFPLHPYTSYLSTFIARYIGSTERSIFNFLFDEEEGFNKFIKNNPVSRDKGIFLTSDYLWDAFSGEFERIDFQRFSNIMETYKLHYRTFSEYNKSYLPVFKGILLLNALFKMVSFEEAKNILVSPSEANIKAMFLGTEYADLVDEVLDFIVEREIISKTPDELFLISSSNLPLKEIENEKNKIRGQYKQIDKIIGSSQLANIEKIFSNYSYREIEFKIFDASLNEHLILNKFKKVFQKDYALHIAMIIPMNNQDRQKCRDKIPSLLSNIDSNNTVFSIIDNNFDEKTFESFIDYKARANVADRHNYKQEEVTNSKYANDVIDQWIMEIKSGYLEWFVKSQSDSTVKQGKEHINNFAKKLNDKINLLIFPKGLDALKEIKKNINIWSFKNAKKTAENFLFAQNREDLEYKTKGGLDKHLRGILKNIDGEDYVVSEKLNFKKNIDQQHPIFLMHQALSEQIQKEQEKTVFHLGSALLFLTKPPYGLYSNMVSFAAMGFLLRGYIGQLYEAGKGKPIEKEVMRDKIESLFRYWKDGSDSQKLKVRLGTAEEKELIRVLVHLFDLKNTESLNDAKWGIREWVKNTGYPLWVFKFIEGQSSSVVSAIDDINRLIISVDEEFDQDKINQILENVKNVIYDLKLTFSKKDKAGALFSKWLKGLDGINLDGLNDFDSLINHIRDNMPEEIGVASWDMDKVQKIVYQWYIQNFVHSQNGDIQPENPTKQETPAFPQPQPGPQPEPNVTTPEAGGNKDELQRINRLQQKIDNYNGDLRKVIKRIVSENSQLISIFENYLP